MKRIISFLLYITFTASLVLGISVPVKAADLTTRNLTDAQIQSIKNDSAIKLRAEISTVADAVAYLNMRFPTLWHSFHIWQGAPVGGKGTAILRSGEEILDNTESSNDDGDNAGRSDIATAVAYLLSDDMTIGSIYGFWELSNSSLGPIKEVNYILKDGKYYIFDPVIGMSGDSISSVFPFLPQETVSSLTEYSNHIKSDPSLNKQIDSIYAVEAGKGIKFATNRGWTTFTEPKISPIYVNNDNNMNIPINFNKKFSYLDPINIGKYKLSTILGSTTMTAEQANALVRTHPQNIKDHVKTAGDLLMYMLASKMQLQNGDETINVDGHQWHYNPPAEVTLTENLGNCGRMANLANYLLEGDYQEVGFIVQSWGLNQGGHVYNYIKYQDKYYIVDFSSYLFSNYNTASEFNFISMDDLKDYGTRVKECYGGVTEIIAHTSPGTHLANVWEGNMCYYPEGADFKVLLETLSTGYSVGTLPCSSPVLDWKKPQALNFILPPEPIVTPMPEATPIPTPTVVPTPVPTVTPVPVVELIPTVEPVVTPEPTPIPVTLPSKTVIVSQSKEIVSIKQISIATKINSKPKLPLTVIVVFNNKATSNMKVTWNTISLTSYKKVGIFSVYGVVKGSKIKAVAKIKVVK